MILFSTLSEGRDIRYDSKLIESSVLELCLAREFYLAIRSENPHAKHLLSKERRRLFLLIMLDSFTSLQGLMTLLGAIHDLTTLFYSF